MVTSLENCDGVKLGSKETLLPWSWDAPYLYDRRRVDYGENALGYY